jgi:hypothetical protein
MDGSIACASTEYEHPSAASAAIRSPRRSDHSAHAGDPVTSCRPAKAHDRRRVAPAPANPSPGRALLRVARPFRAGNRRLGSGTRSHARCVVEVEGPAEGAGWTISDGTALSPALVGSANFEIRIAMAGVAALIVALTGPGAQVSAFDTDQPTATRTRPTATIRAARKPIAGGHASRWPRWAAISTAGGPRIVRQRGDRHHSRSAQPQHALEHLPPALTCRQ